MPHAYRDLVDGMHVLSKVLVGIGLLRADVYALQSTARLLTTINKQESVMVDTGY